MRPLLSACLALVLLTPGEAAEPVDVSADLAVVLARHKVPAIGCVVVRSNAMVALGVAGVRKHGDKTAVTVNDRWHHGSNTKSMTATLAALLVADGTIDWDSTLADVFPDKVDAMKPAWRNATLEQLLANRGGAPANLDAGGLWGRLWAHPGTPREGRALVLQELTRRDPAYPPGTKNLYSNGGFTLAGHMLETAADRDWEALVNDRLFLPLGMKSTGFGAPGTPGKIDQPLGHSRRFLRLNPVPPGPKGDNPPTIGPAGTVHAPLGDMARYLGLHLAGARSEATALLDGKAFRTLQADVAEQGYALGWLVTKRDWGGGKVLHHGGSNTMWFSNIWLAPEKNFAVLAVANVGKPAGFKATDDVVGTMIGRFLANEKP